jgi:AcrR family transcriptional regulator
LHGFDALVGLDAFRTRSQQGTKETSEDCAEMVVEAGLRIRTEFAERAADRFIIIEPYSRNHCENASTVAFSSAAGLGVATVYRHFGTKERIVLWDEYDPALSGHARELIGRGVLSVAQSAIKQSLDAFYAADRVRILRRSRLVAETPALASASLSDLAELRSKLARVFVTGGGAVTQLSAEVAAGAVIVCLQAAADAWVRAKGRPRLSRLIDEAFQELGALSATSLPQRPVVSRARRRK